MIHKMNYTFYTIGYNQEGKEFIVSSEYKDRMDAKADIEDQITNEGFSYTGMIYQVKGKGKQDKTNTKFYLHRKRNNGRNPRSYDAAL